MLVGAGGGVGVLHVPPLAPCRAIAQNVFLSVFGSDPAIESALYFDEQGGSPTLAVFGTA